MNTCHVHSTGLSAPRSFYLLALQILPDPVLSCSYLLSSQTHLAPAPLAFLFLLFSLPLPAFFLIHLMHFTHPTPAFYPYLVSQTVHQNPQGAIKHQAQQLSLPQLPEWETNYWQQTFRLALELLTSFLGSNSPPALPWGWSYCPSRGSERAQNRSREARGKSPSQQGWEILP